MDGTYYQVTPQGSSYSNLRLAVKNLSTGITIDDAVVTEARIFRAIPGTTEVNRNRQWDGPSGFDNFRDFGLADNKSYATYLRLFINAQADGATGGNAEGETDWETGASGAWVPYIRWTYHMPPGYALTSCG